MNEWMLANIQRGSFVFQSAIQIYKNLNFSYVFKTWSVILTEENMLT